MVGNGRTVTKNLEEKNTGQESGDQSKGGTKEWQRGSHSHMKGALCKQRQPARSEGLCRQQPIWSDWEKMGPPARRGP